MESYKRYEPMGIPYYIADLEEVDVDIDADMDDDEDDNQDSFFPLAGEDETEFGVNWCIRGVVATILASEAAEALNPSQAQKTLASERKTLTSPQKENGKIESKADAKKEKRSPTCPGKTYKKKRKSPKSKPPMRVEKKTYPGTKRSSRWVEFIKKEVNQDRLPIHGRSIKTVN